MARLKQQYPHIDEQQEWLATAAKAQEWNTYGPNLNDVFELMTFEERKKAAGEEDFRKGLEEARLE